MEGESGRAVKQPFMFLSRCFLPPSLCGWAVRVVAERRDSSQTAVTPEKRRILSQAVAYRRNRTLLHESLGEILTLRMFSFCCPKEAFWLLYVEAFSLSDVHKPKMPGNWIGPVRNRLAAHRAEKPTTKAGQIRALWPEIEAALAGGQSMKSIRQWLEIGRASCRERV